MGSTQSSSRRDSRLPSPGSSRLPRRESSITSRSQEALDSSESASLRYRRYSAFPDPSLYAPAMPSPRTPRKLPMTPQTTPRPKLTDTPWPKNHLLRRNTYARGAEAVMTGPRQTCDY